jgi:hypothetical protein
VYSELLVPFFDTAMLIRVAKFPIREVTAMTHRTVAFTEALVVKVGASSNSEELSRKSFDVMTYGMRMFGSL